MTIVPLPDARVIYQQHYDNVESLLPECDEGEGVRCEFDTPRQAARFYVAALNYFSRHYGPGFVTLSKRRSDVFVAPGPNFDAARLEE